MKEPKWSHQIIGEGCPPKSHLTPPYKPSSASSRLYIEPLVKGSPWKPPSITGY